MPTYGFKCDSCHHEFERVLRLTDYTNPQVCPECQGGTKRTMASPSFVLAGDGWPGKNIRIQGQMADKNRRLDAKSRDIPVGQRMVPNVGGEEVDSWAEAQRLAASKGKDTSSYESQIRQEGSS